MREGAVRDRYHAYVRMACRSARPHGPHDQGERERFQKAMAKDFKTASRKYISSRPLHRLAVRGPEEPVEGMDEAGRGAVNLPGQDRPTRG
jgi:hypothetical protein